MFATYVIPCADHAIDVEIPEGNRRIVRTCYYAYLAFIIALLWNFCAVCAQLHYVGASTIGQWLMSVIFVITATPGALPTLACRRLVMTRLVGLTAIDP